MSDSPNLGSEMFHRKVGNVFHANLKIISAWFPQKGKSNALKGLLTRFGEQGYSYKVKRLYCLIFQRLAQMGITESIGFKLSTYKCWVFSQKCVKGCPTVVQLYKKIVNQNSGLYSKYLWKFQNNANIAPISGKISVSKTGNVIKQSK